MWEDPPYLSHPTETVEGDDDSEDIVKDVG